MTVNKYNNIYHRTVKMKPANVKSSAYKEGHKFKVGDLVRISK